MELQQLVAVVVETYDKNNQNVKVSVAVQENNTVVGSDVKRKTCQALGLKQTSHDLFSLFICNSNAKIIQRVRETDCIRRSSSGLVLRKWCFNQKRESKVIQDDDAACRLVFCQAEKDIETGKLMPSNDQEQKLEEYTDPGFTVEPQYIYICQSINDYFSVRADNCAMCHEAAAERRVTVVVSADGVRVDSSGQSGQLTIPLYCIQRWSINYVSSVILYLYRSSADQDINVSLRSDQYHYLHAATMEAVKEFQVKHADQSSFFSSMITTSPNGAITVQENAVFDADKARKYDIDTSGSQT